MPRILTLALSLLALVPSFARAATTYYATPSPQGEPNCSQVAPCGVTQALEFAQPGDTVQLGAGTYTGPVNNSQAITIKGAPGTRPTITGVAEPAVALSGGTLSDVEVVQTAVGAYGLLVSSTGVAERVVVRSTGSGATAAYLMDGGTLRNSAAFAPDSEAYALQVASAPNGVTVTNVTARAGGIGLEVAPSSMATVVNTIIRGDFDDIAAPSAIANVSHSVYRPAEATNVTDAGGNLATAPLLAEDGIHQLAGSPTLDAGAAQTGNDIDGDARTLGSAPDIGADERPLPAVDPPADNPPTTGDPGPTPPQTQNPPVVIPVDLSLPGFLSVRFPAPPVAGKASDLVIEAYDPDAALLGVVVDLGPAGVVGLSACTTLKPTGPFVRGQPVKFTVPVIFPAPGLQPYTLEIRSGGCGGSSQQVSRSDLTAQVNSGALTARAAQASKCASTLAPRAGREAAVAAAVICLMNRERAKKRLRPLTLNAKLVKSAAAHTADMLAKRYYNHQRPGGPSLKARTRRAKYRGNSGENLGLASGSLAQPGPMMGMWMKSPMHRANVLNRRFRAVGVSVQAKDPLGKMTGAAIYTVNFGTRK